MFSADALGSYTLFDPAEREALLARIDEAWRTLSDPELRARYDEETLGLIRAPSIAPPAPPKPPAFSYADLAVTDVTGAALPARPPRGHRPAVAADRRDHADQHRVPAIHRGGPREGPSSRRVPARLPHAIRPRPRPRPAYRRRRLPAAPANAAKQENLTP